ncbi:MAG: hypothetical protein AABZ47_15070 [Planctomycetota bacterium]
MMGPRTGRAMAAMVVSLIVSWFVYVPIHEIMHAYGCLWTGGSVTELQVDAKYGAAILKEFFPFVVSGGEYAGRLTGFDTKGSDFCYFMTVFLPFVPTVLLGVPMLRWCAKRRRSILFGTGIVIGLAPIYQVWGDYYEMGSILVTRLLTYFSGNEKIVYKVVRADDVFRLIGDLFTKRQELGLQTVGQLFIAYFLVVVCLTVSILWAFVTYGLGRLFSRAIQRS